MNKDRIWNEIAPVYFFIREINRNLDYIDASVYNLDLTCDKELFVDVKEDVKALSEQVAKIRNKIELLNSSIKYTDGGK